MDSHEKKVEVGAEGMKIVEGERECTLKKASSGPFFSYTPLVFPIAIIIPCMFGVIIACPGSRNHVKHNSSFWWRTERGQQLCYRTCQAPELHALIRVRQQSGIQSDTSMTKCLILKRIMCENPRQPPDSCLWQRGNSQAGTQATALYPNWITDIKPAQKLKKVWLHDSIRKSVHTTWQYRVPNGQPTNHE